MSRYSLRPLAAHADLFEVAIGWDAGLGTFFATVFGTPGGNLEPDVRLACGTTPREVVDVGDILAVAARFAEIPKGLAGQLERDRIARPHDPKCPAVRLLEDILWHGQH
ncbi:hypothetical protein [Sphingobium yanoikuyae]|uniref:hypothetical protein n=1 Tax=Sphingobium yanoikuyae TaxID=13690 RepID=UPI0019D0CB7D|nr:hypothetical protein [Sphingobium yanoikuyae]